MRRILATAMTGLAILSLGLAGCNRHDDNGRHRDRGDRGARSSSADAGYGADRSDKAARKAARRAARRAARDRDAGY